MIEDKFYFERKIFSRENHSFLFKEDKSLIKEILSRKKSGSVLDLGCGEGGNSLRLASLGFKVTCVDISRTAIDSIKKESKKRKLNLTAVCKDIEKNTIKQKYDVIICTGVLHLISDKNAKKIVNQIKENTKSKGMNILDVLTGKGYFKRGEILSKYSNWKILDFTRHKESFGTMEWIVAEKRE